MSMTAYIKDTKGKEDLFAELVIILMIALLFLGAPSVGAFYWSDATRHALNGIFVKDFLQTLPLHNPTEFAHNYYVKYPALTIIFNNRFSIFSVRLCSGYLVFRIKLHS